MKYFWLKVTGTAFLLLITLVAVSILEVAIYSYLIVPGKTNEFYSGHAEVSAPWVSAIFGSLFTFILVRRFIKRFPEKRLLYAAGLPVIYIIIDLTIIAASGINILSVLLIISLSNGSKLLAALAAYYIYNSKYPKVEPAAQN